MKWGSNLHQDPASHREGAAGWLVDIPEHPLLAPPTARDMISPQGSSGEIVVAKDNYHVESPDESCCRICLEYGDKKRGNELISPCLCKGTQQFVHRSCLDQWRSVKEGFAFSHCTTCTAPFHLRVNLAEITCWRKTQFYFFVARDILFVFLLIQLIVIGIGTLSYLLDRNGHFRDSFNDGWFHVLAEFQILFYYCLGVFIFLAISGVVGAIMHCLSFLNDEQTTSDEDVVNPHQSSEFDYVPVLVDAPNVHSSRFRRDQDVPNDQPTPTETNYYCSSIQVNDCCSGTDSTDCCCSCLCGNVNQETCCSCSSHNCCSSEGNDCSEGIKIVVIPLVIVFVILGILYGVYAASVTFQRIWKRHYHFLKKRELTKEYVVEDLHGNYALPQLPPEHKNRLKLLKLM